MNIQGRDCTLTVARDGVFYPLPYSEETVRETSKGYSLPCVIGRRNRDKYIQTGRLIQGCFVSRLEYLNVYALFLLLFNRDQSFDIYTDRSYEKEVYKNVNVKSFELRATNGEAFKFKADICSNENSYVSTWPVNLFDLKWQKARTYYYNGHNVYADYQKMDLMYRFELNGNFDRNSEYIITLYFPLSQAQHPQRDIIEKLVIEIDNQDGITLELNDLRPLDNLCDINCADTVLFFQKFRVNGNIILSIRNQNENLQVIL